MCICNYGGVSVITVYLCVSVCVSVTMVMCLLSQYFCVCICNYSDVSVITVYLCVYL